MSTDALTDVTAMAARQRGLITYDQLNDAGITDREIQVLLRHGWLVRKRPEVYAIQGCPESWERELLAVVLSAGDGAAASHSCGARLWTYRYLPEGGFEITTARADRPRLRGVSVHRVMTLEPGEVTVIDGIPVTSFARTLVDCSSRLSAFQLGRVLDDGLRRGVTSLRDLSACVDHLVPARGRSVAAVRRLLDVRGPGYHPGGSASERRVLDVLASAGLPLPVQQHPVRVDGRRYVLDFAYVEEMGFIEYYGLPFHSGASAVAYDSARLSALSARGWRPLIFTDDTSDREIVRRVAELLGVVIPKPHAA